MPGYPSGSDVELFLAGAGMLPTDATQLAAVRMQCTGWAEAAAEDWEHDTGWEPYLAGSADTTRMFTPRDVLEPRNEPPMLDLKGGLLSATTITVDVQPGNPGVQLTEGSDFWLKPDNAPAKGRPYTWVEFWRVPGWAYFGLGADQRSIVIVGKWGYTASVDAHVRQALLCHAASNAAPMLAAARTGGMQKWSEADTSEAYSDNPFGAMQEVWQREYDKAVSAHRRVKLA